MSVRAVCACLLLSAAISAHAAWCLPGRPCARAAWTPEPESFTSVPFTEGKHPAVRIEGILITRGARGPKGQFRVKGSVRTAALPDIESRALALREAARLAKDRGADALIEMQTRRLPPSSDYDGVLERTVWLAVKTEALDLEAPSVPWTDFLSGLWKPGMPLPAPGVDRRFGTAGVIQAVDSGLPSVPAGSPPKAPAKAAPLPARRHVPALRPQMPKKSVPRPPNTIRETVEPL